MTFTYGGNPANSSLEEIRFLIGDTVSTDQQLSDEEINYLLADSGSVHATAIAACTSLIAKYSRLVDKSVDGLRLNYSQRVSNYKALLMKLQNRQAAKGATLVAGGLSIARKTTNQNDSDLVQSDFRRGQFDNAGGSSQDPLTDSGHIP